MFKSKKAKCVRCGKSVSMFEALCAACRKASKR